VILLSLGHGDHFATPSTSPSAPARRGRDRRARRRDRRQGVRRARTRTTAAPSCSTGAGSSSSGPGTPRLTERDGGPRLRLLIHIGDHLIYTSATPRCSAICS
jgi:hypothetical protein